MISVATYRDHPAVIELWELSVRATHHFLPEDHLQEIKSLLPAILSQVKLYVWRENDNTIKGFAGVVEQKLEMLFIHPGYGGHGLGRQFTMFCIYSLRVDRVDVNEQNQTAVGFYEKMGYRMIGRQEKDGMGKPFPILNMQYAQME